MGLISSRTKWVLFLASSSEPEDRHIQDIAFGLHCLELAGISQDDIRIYIDGSDRHSIAQLVSTGSDHEYQIMETALFFKDQQANEHANLVMFVTGHGNINGIDANPPISPHTLLKSIKSSNNLEKSIIYLGQCYAGVFNFIGAGRKKEGEPDVIFIGATNLHESISLSTQETLPKGNVSWIANIFILNVFKWISSPIDVDGDGKFTIMDSHKYAGANSSFQNKAMKIGSFVRSMHMHSQWTQAQTAHEADPVNMMLRLNYDAITTRYESELSVRYIHQECWILNAIPAQFIEI